MVDATRHLLQVEHNITPANALVPPPLGLRNAPDVLSADQMATATGRNRLLMPNPVRPVAIGEQTIIAPESIGAHPDCPDRLPNALLPRWARHIGLRTGYRVSTASWAQRRKDDACALHGRTPPVRADAAAGAIITFNFALHLRSHFTGPHHGLAKTRVDSLGGLPNDATLPSGQVSWGLRRKEASPDPKAPSPPMGSGE